MLAVLAGAGMGTAGFGAVPTPAHWTVRDVPRTAGVGRTFAVRLVGTIEPGWHIYAMEEPEGGPIATEVGLAEGNPLTLLAVDEPEARMALDPVLRTMTGMFQDEVSFRLRLRGRRGMLPGAVNHIVVRYQSCNERVCLPPRTETVSFTLSGGVR